LTDTKRLEEIIASKGLKSSYIAEKLGISYPSFWGKMTGKRQFKVSEIGTLKEILGLTKAETYDIFLG
jgi:hypothetical protein